MSKLKKLFFDINMSWKKVLLFAILSGVYTGLISQISFFKDTSFQDISISYEMWVLFAVIITSNCKKPFEAGLKCFIFFLISQPLVYIVELPTLGHFPWNYYRFWFILTLLTLPGGFIAYFSKKDNFISTLIISIANILLVILGIADIKQMITIFPHHLLSSIFCFSLAILFVLVFNTKKLNRIIGLFIIFISTVILSVMTFGNLGKVFTNVNSIDSFSINEGNNWSCSLGDDSYGTVKVDNGHNITLNMIKIGKTVLTCKDSSNKKIVYNISLDSSNIINREEEK